jgi:beta-lactamase class A
MQNHFFTDRRTFILGAASLCVLAGAGCESTPELGTEEADLALAQLESTSGGRIGVSAVNMQNARAVSYRGDERFAMCSSFKWLLGYFMMQRDYPGSIDEKISYTEDDLVPWSPVTEPALKTGGLTIRELCEAAIQTSDNTASNLLLKELGGPQGLTSLLRGVGDEVTRLDRWEPDLNENAPGDVRDTTTPDAMTSLVSGLLFGSDGALNERAIVREMMIGATTGNNRLRAGIGEEWVTGDKTGTSSNNQSNDIAFAFMPPTLRGTKGPVIITSYLNVPDPMDPATDKLHEEIARLVMKSVSNG